MLLVKLCKAPQIFACGEVTVLPSKQQQHMHKVRSVEVCRLHVQGATRSECRRRTVASAQQALLVAVVHRMQCPPKA
jgi:hypothetical protein